MGISILFLKNNSHKKLKDLLFENFSDFQHWYLEENKSSSEEFYNPCGNEELISYFKRETDFKSNFHALDKKLIDELTSAFVETYTDLSDQGSKLLECFGPMFSRWRYAGSNEMVTQTKDKDLINLWNFIMKGRSLKDYGNFDSYTNDFTVGFLSFEEHIHLRSLIIKHFGNAEEMKEKYWTPDEKKQWEEAIEKEKKDGYFGISQHNPKSTGLEFVLEALDEIKDDKNELITGFE